jgi:hypothetical protein
MITPDSVRWLTTNYSNMSVLNVCNNCDNILENNEVKYIVKNTFTGEVHKYCSNVCLQSDIRHIGD